MQSFDYHRPTTLAEALRLKREAPGARFIAGGTDLMVRLREGRATPPALISLRGVGELSLIDLGAPIRIGAATPISEILEHVGLREVHPVLARAARTLGSVQVRNAATVGGNLCNASPCADMAPPLLVHDARVRLESTDGAREMSLEEFFVAPGETRVSEGELLTEIRFEPPPGGARATFLKKGRVRMDIALASVSVLLHVSDGRCRHVRVAAGSVGPRPMRLHRVEALLADQEPSDELLEQARQVAREEVQPISDVRASADYRRHIVGVFVGRALTALRDGREP